MKISIDDREAESVAEQLVADRRIDRLPVCPFTIAKDKGIDVQPRESDKPGVSGFLMRVGNQFGILYATHVKNDGFIRFTVSHELGHYFLPGHCEHLFPPEVFLHESRSGYLSHDPRERQADTFASALLMPENLFLAALREAGSGFEAIEKLAKSCRTSITSTAIRYARFAEDPVAVIVSRGNSIDYCFMSAAMEEIRGLRFLGKGTVLPPNSLTASFNRDEANIAGGLQEGGYSTLADWFDGVSSGIEMKEDVVGLGTYGRTLTVLFSDEALPDDEDDGDDDDD
jgi:Zn-dependent peptidase ImmA (M78 family)